MIMKELRWLAIILSAMFAGAKLAGVIAWSWWLVMLPAILVFGLPIVIAVALFVAMLFAEAYLIVRDAWRGFKRGWHEEMEARKK